MSKENHSNFQAVKFAANVTAFFFKSLRGNADKNRLDINKVSEKIHKFCFDMEELADDSAKSPVDFGPIKR